VQTRPTSSHKNANSRSSTEDYSGEVCADLTLNEHKTAQFLNRSREASRQEKETFDQRKNHDERWFTLRERIGNAAIIFLSGIAIFCICIILAWQFFPPVVVIGAVSALFADVIGVVVGIWKTVINPSSITQLEPVTIVDQDRLKVTKSEGSQRLKPVPNSTIKD
jgi:hypothetical protein